MWQAIAGVVVAAIAVAAGGSVEAQGGLSAVRPEDAGTRALVERGLQRSTTFRDLNARLDASDVVVYVRFARCRTGVGACLSWLSAAAGARRLQILLDKFGRSPDELTALLAHELQHANEVASVHAITDLDSFRRAFASLGWRVGDGFETEQAKTITRTVAAELFRAARTRRPDAPVADGRTSATASEASR